MICQPSDCVCITPRNNHCDIITSQVTVVIINKLIEKTTTLQTNQWVMSCFREGTNHTRGGRAGGQGPAVGRGGRRSQLKARARALLKGQGTGPNSSSDQLSGMVTNVILIFLYLSTQQTVSLHMNCARIWVNLQFLSENTNLYDKCNGKKRSLLARNIKSLKSKDNKSMWPWPALTQLRVQPIHVYSFFFFWLKWVSERQETAIVGADFQGPARPNTSRQTL